MSMPADGRGRLRYRPDGSYEIHPPEPDGTYQVVFPVTLSEENRRRRIATPVTITHNIGPTDVHVTIPQEDAYAALNRRSEEYRRWSAMTSGIDGARWQHEPWHWPTRDDEYPCQLCWAVNRWPWEPARGCPITVPVEATYCDRHRELVGTS